MKILVAGGAGFIGSHLCERLLNDGHEVICLDNFSTGTTSNISHLFSNTRLKMLHQEIEEFTDGKIDQIYNLASPASPAGYRQDSLKTLQTNVVGTTRLLEIARSQDIPMLQVSTIRVIEQEDHLGPNACYIEGKRCAETLCFEYFKKYLTPIKIARFFSVYGPRMSKNDSRVVPQFIQKALRGEALTLYGDGKQLDSFAYVSDIVDALILFMNSNFVGEAIEFGYTPLISIHDLAMMILQITKSKSEILNIEAPFRTPKTPDIRARILFDWFPKVNLYEGLKLTIESMEA